MKLPLPALVCAALFAGCGEELVGYDLEADALHGKADFGPCTGYSGGPLNGDDLLALVNKDAEQ